MSRNRCGTVCDCGLPLAISIDPKSAPMTEAEYAKISPSMRRHLGNHGHGWHCDSFALIVCRNCGRRFSGWLKDGELVDSSYWHAFNDEPGPGDEPPGAPFDSLVGLMTRLFEGTAQAREEVEKLRGALKSIADTYCDHPAGAIAEDALLAAKGTP